MPERRYKVLSPVGRERVYGVGEFVVMDEAEAEPLLARVIEPVDEAAEPPEEPGDGTATRKAKKEAAAK